MQKEGITLEIQRRVLDVLTYLIENRSRTVSKDELQDAVWPGTVVTEAALTRGIMKARKILDDDANDPRFIKTVHGQGYRFIGEVRVVAADPDLATPMVDVAARRNALLRVATTYGAGAWLLNQAAAMVWEAFEWDRWPQQALLAVSVLGFPLVLGIAWFYRATPQGVALRTERAATLVAPPAKRWQLWVMLTLALALTLSVTWNLRRDLFMSEATQAGLVAVLPVANLTGQAEMEWLALGMMSLIDTQLKEADIVTLASRIVLQEVAEGSHELTAESHDLLSKSYGLAQTVRLQVTEQGGQYEASGSYGDATARFELPSYGGATVAEALRRMGDHLVRVLSPKQTVQMDVPSVGDAFADQVYARGMYELLSGNLKRAKELLTVAANAYPKSFWPNYELNVVLRKLGEFDAAKNRNLTWLKRSEAAEATVQVAVVSNELGVIFDLTGDLDAAEQSYLRGLDWATRGEHHERKAVLLINYAILERARANPLRARELLGRAMTAYADAGVELIPGDFYITMGNASADAGDYNDAKAQYQTGLAHYRQAKRVRGEGLALANLSWVSEHLGDYAAAHAYLDQSESLRERIEDVPGLLKVKARRADLYYARGRLSEVLALAQEIEQHPYAQQEREVLTNAWNYRAFVALEQAEYAQALALFKRAHAMDLEDGRVYGQVRAELGEVRALLGLADLAEARLLLARVLDSTGAQKIPEFALQAEGLVAEVAWREGDEEAAIETTKRAIEAARLKNNAHQIGLLAAQLARYYDELEQVEQVAAWVGVGVDALPNHGQVQLAQARLARARGQKQSCLDFVQAATQVMGLRMQPEQERLKNSCGRLSEVGS